MKLKKEKIISEKESIANILKETRKFKKLKLAKIAQELNINIKYLRVLESGRFHELPEGVYGKNYLKEYAIFLGLNYKELLELYREDKEEFIKKSKSNLFSKQVIKARSFFIMPKIVKNILIVLIVLVCFVYLGFYINRIVSPPFIDIYEPVDNLIVNKNFINIVGVSEKESHVLINGELILLEEDGQFVKRIDLKPGINTIIVKAKKKYSREAIIRKQVVYEHE